MVWTCFILYIIFFFNGSVTAKGNCEAVHEDNTQVGVTYGKNIDYCQSVDFECGRSTLSSSNKALAPVDRLPASPGYFPWQASIITTKDGEWTKLCGGTLVTSKLVLTAAYCLYIPINSTRSILAKPEVLTVVLGKLNNEWKRHDSLEIRRQVINIEVHSKFRGYGNDFVYDLAVLQLECNVLFNDFVMPACLDYNLTKLAPLTEGDVIYTAGFSNIKDGTSDLSSKSDNLMYFVTPVLSDVKCLCTGMPVYLHHLYYLIYRKFCIGGDKVSPINDGHRGDGITTIHGGLHYLTGVTSNPYEIYNGNGFTCKYGSVTNVTDHMKWIRKYVHQ